MPERETNKDTDATNRQPQRGDDRDVSQHPDLGERPDPDAQRSTASRPRGHTEEPDRTL